MSLLIADIDQFASVNYDLGYQAGDEILRRIATTLQEDESPDRVRTSDVVARYSGEEFIILLPETPKAGAGLNHSRKTVRGGAIFSKRGRRNTAVVSCHAARTAANPRSMSPVRRIVTAATSRADDERSAPISASPSPLRSPGPRRSAA